MKLGMWWAGVLFGLWLINIVIVVRSEQKTKLAMFTVYLMPPIILGHTLHALEMPTAAFVFFAIGTLVLVIGCLEWLSDVIARKVSRHVN